MIIIYDELRFTTGMQSCFNILKSTNIKNTILRKKKGKYMTISIDEEKVSEKKKKKKLSPFHDKKTLNKKE